MPPVTSRKGEEGQQREDIREFYKIVGTRPKTIPPTPNVCVRTCACM